MKKLTSRLLIFAGAVGLIFSMMFQPFTPSSKTEGLLQKIEEMSTTEFKAKYGEKERAAFALGLEQNIKETKEAERVSSTITTLSFFTFGIGLILWILTPNKPEQDNPITRP